MKLCECDCGTPTKIVRWSNASRGLVGGQPRRFVKGHNSRKRDIRGECNPNWKGDEARASALHMWLAGNHQKTGVCEECGDEAPTDYAFKRHPEPYTRNREDYRELCKRCHVEYDIQNGQRPDNFNKAKGTP
jgi:hypothetical protein